MEVPELRYPDECCVCSVDACSMCGHKQKRINAVNFFDSEMDKYLKS